MNNEKQKRLVEYLHEARGTEVMHSWSEATSEGDITIEYRATDPSWKEPAILVLKTPRGEDIEEARGRILRMFVIEAAFAFTQHSTRRHSSQAGAEQVAPSA